MIGKLFNRYEIEEAEQYACDLCLQYLRKAQNYKFWYYTIIIAVSAFTLFIGVVINQSDSKDPIYLEKIKNAGLIIIILEFVHFIVAILALYKQWRSNENAGIAILEIIREYDARKDEFKAEKTRNQKLYSAVLEIEKSKHKANAELNDQIQEIVEKQLQIGGKQK